MRILVVGAGATGGYFGGRLARAGRDVTFLVRPRRAEVLRARGLRIVGLGEEESIEPRLVTAAELDGPYDVVLVTVKASGLDQALEDAAPAVGPDTAVIPFLNGMAHLDVLNTRFGKESVLGGVVKVVASVNDDGDIERYAPLSTFEFGEQDGTRSARVQDLRRLLDVPGYELSVPADIIAAMWHKWFFIATVSTLTCLLRGTVGDIVAIDGGVDFALAVLAEIEEIPGAAGFPVPVDQTDFARTTVTETGSPIASSLFRDVEAGRPTEVEHVLADLAARARALSVDTPILDLAVRQLRVHQYRCEQR